MRLKIKSLKLKFHEWEENKYKRVNRKLKKVNSWRPYFTWRPVRISDTEISFLEKVYRSGTCDVVWMDGRPYKIRKIKWKYMSVFDFLKQKEGRTDNDVEQSN